MTLELLDFYADWCGPCKVMEPVLQEVESQMKDKISVKKIDVDNDEEQTSKYGVLSIPTYIILKDGQEVDRFIGAQPRESFLSKIQQHLT